MAEARYVRFIRTASVRKVLNPLRDEIVMRLEALRSFQEDVGRGEPAPNWVQIKNRSITSVIVGYNCLMHGRFSKDSICSVLDDTGCVDMLIDRLDVLIPEKTRIADRVARIMRDSSLKRERFVAQFVQYPVRGDEREKLLPSLSDIRDPYEGELGFHFTILDLDNIMWLQNWKETQRKKVSSEYQEAIEKWKAIFKQVKGVDLRRVMQETFGRDIVDSREYLWGEKEGWYLSRTGRW